MSRWEYWRMAMHIDTDIERLFAYSIHTYIVCIYRDTVGSWLFQRIYMQATLETLILEFHLVIHTHKPLNIFVYILYARSERVSERLVCLFRWLTLKFPRWLEASGYISMRIYIYCALFSIIMPAEVFFPMDIDNSVWISYFLFSLFVFRICLRVCLIKFDVLILQLFLYDCTKAISSKMAEMHSELQAGTCMSEEYRLTNTLHKAWAERSGLCGRRSSTLPTPLSVSFEIEKTIKQKAKENNNNNNNNVVKAA